MLFTNQELAQIRVAVKRKSRGLSLDGFSEKVLSQLETGEPKFYKIELYRTEDDCYNELWKVVGEDKFVIRHVCGLPYFAAVSDPLGYCEMDYTLNDNNIFIVCNNSRELFGLSNLDGAEFPTLKETCRNEWNRIKSEYPHFGDNVTASWWSECFGNGSTMTTDKWLLSFMDPEKYKKEIEDMYGYPENWVARMETVKRELIGGFQYLGKEFYIFKETQRHKVCGKEVINYYVDNKQILGKWDGHVMFLDDYCEGELGPMYTEREAVNILSKALKREYGGKQISVIHNSYGYVYERFISYEDAAKQLLKHNYNRKRVQQLIAKERLNHSFWIHNDPEIEKKYPGYHRDHSYNYDFMGRRI